MVAAECLRHFRDPQKWPFPEGKIKYVEDVFALLGAITGDAIFKRLLEEHRNMEDLDMKNSFERVRNFYRSEGFDLGERSGEMRGIKLGRNVARGVVSKSDRSKLRVTCCRCVCRSTKLQRQRGYRLKRSNNWHSVTHDAGIIASASAGASSQSTVSHIFCRASVI